MTSGKYRVFSVPPQMSWQETDFSQSKGKSARKCVSVDSSRSQLLSSDRTVTVRMPRDLCASCWNQRHTDYPTVVTTETTGLSWRWGSTRKVRSRCGTKHLELKSLISIPGSAFHELCRMSFNLSDPLLYHLQI